MKPTNLKTKIFLDSGDPAETKAIIDLLGFLDGQTTNPTLVAQNPYAKQRFEKGEKFSAAEIKEFYKQVVGEISVLIPTGSVSVEVYADALSTADQLFDQGQEMFAWIPNAHIKYPVNAAGLAAANRSIAAGHRVNMTLCFTQEQAAAVFAATKGAKPGDVFVSPFIGRLDDIGTCGIDLVSNIIIMYQSSDHHTAVLAASVRHMEHFMQLIANGADIITAPFKILQEWGEAGKPLPPENQTYVASGLENIPYETIDLERPWTDFDLSHELTDKGLERFSSDWNSLIS